MRTGRCVVALRIIRCGTAGRTRRCLIGLGVIRCRTTRFIHDRRPCNVRRSGRTGCWCNGRPFRSILFPPTFFGLPHRTRSVHYWFIRRTAVGRGHRCDDRGRQWSVPHTWSRITRRSIRARPCRHIAARQSDRTAVIDRVRIIHRIVHNRVIIRIPRIVERMIERHVRIMIPVRAMIHSPVRIVEIRIIVTADPGGIARIVVIERYAEPRAAVFIVQIIVIIDRRSTIFRYGLGRIILRTVTGFDRGQFSIASGNEQGAYAQES